MSNVDACGGHDNEGDGCGVVFPRMPAGGMHCAQCKKLKAPGQTPEAIAGLLVSLTYITFIATHSHSRLAGNTESVL